MKKWKTARLGDYCSFQEGYVNPSQRNPDYFDGDIKWIRAVDLNDGYIYDTSRKLTTAGFHSAGKSALLFKPETIVISKSGTIGRLGIIKDYMCGNRATINIVPKANADLYFIFYLLLSNQKMISDLAVGSVQRNLYVSILENASFSFPDLDEQKQIGRFISSITNKITVNNRLNDNLLQQALAIFTSWFIRFDQFSGIKPDNWETTSLDNLCSLISRGVTPKYDDASDQIVINQKCIRNHMLDLLPARRHRPKAVNEKWLKYGDLLINSTGEGTLGRSAQVYFEPYNMTVDSHVTIVRPAQEHLIFYVGMWGLLHEREIEALHTGSTGQTELPRERLKSMEILLPDRDTLIHFDESISPMAQMIIRNQRENARLALLRDSLLPRLMSGEIDVSSVTL